MTRKNSQFYFLKCPVPISSPSTGDRVYDMERRKKDQARQELRSAAQGTGDRADKIRTYNFPQDRVTDHRVGETVTGVSRVMNGEAGLSQILDALLEWDERQRLEEFLEVITKRDKRR
jgi:protein subunit release factor A